MRTQILFILLCLGYSVGLAAQRSHIYTITRDTDDVIKYSNIQAANHSHSPQETITNTIQDYIDLAYLSAYQRYTLYASKEFITG